MESNVYPLYILFTGNYLASIDANELTSEIKENHLRNHVICTCISVRRCNWIDKCKYGASFNKDMWFAYADRCILGASLWFDLISLNDSFVSTNTNDGAQMNEIRLIHPK